MMLPETEVILGTTDGLEEVLDIETKIAEAFPEEPELMIKVAWCESRLNPNAVSSTHDYGLFQINDLAHGMRMQQLGLDPLNEDDNITYARMLYDDGIKRHGKGSKAWYMSEHCWGNNTLAMN